MEQPNNNQFPFSIEFQYALLHYMMIDEVFLIKCAKNIKWEYFNNKYLSWMFTTIASYYENYGTMPSFSILENEARKHDPSTQKEYFDILQRVIKTIDFEPQYMSRELTAFVRQQIFINSAHRAASLYNSANREDAYNFLKEKLDELIQVDFDKEDLIMFKDIEQYIDKESNLAVNAIPTGIQPIDEEMHGGLAKGSLTVLLSATSAGKTMCLVNIAKYAVLAGKKVLYVIHEDEKGPTAIRFISCWTKIPYNKILCGNDMLSQEEKDKIKAVKRIMDEYMVIRYMPGVNVCIEDVYEWAKLKKKQFDYDILIDDYGQFIRSKKKFQEERHVEAHVYMMLKQMAMELNVAVLTPAQGNREANKLNAKGIDLIRHTDISECFKICMLANNVITLNRSEEQKRRGELIYFLTKQRHGASTMAVKCYTDFSRCCTHEPGKMLAIDPQNILLSDTIEPQQSGLSKDDETKV